MARPRFLRGSRTPQPILEVCPLTGRRARSPKDFSATATLNSLSPTNTGRASGSNCRNPRKAFFRRSFKPQRPSTTSTLGIRQAPPHCCEDRCAGSNSARHPLQASPPGHYAATSASGCKRSIVVRRFRPSIRQSSRGAIKPELSFWNQRWA